MQIDSRTSVDENIHCLVLRRQFLLHGIFVMCVVREYRCECHTAVTVHTRLVLISYQCNYRLPLYKLMSNVSRYFMYVYLKLHWSSLNYYDLISSVLYFTKIKTIQQFLGWKNEQQLCIILYTFLYYILIILKVQRKIKHFVLIYIHVIKDLIFFFFVVYIRYYNNNLYSFCTKNKNTCSKIRKVESRQDKKMSKSKIIN